MAKIRVYEIAKEIGIDSKDLVEKLKAMGFEVISHASALEEFEARDVIEKLKVERKADMPKSKEDNVCVHPGCGKKLGKLRFRLPYCCGRCGKYFCSKHFYQTSPDELLRRFEDLSDRGVSWRRQCDGVCHRCDKERTEDARWYKEGGFSAGDKVVFSSQEEESYRETLYRIEEVVILGEKGALYYVLVPLDPVVFDYCLAVEKGGVLKPDIKISKDVSNKIYEKANCFGPADNFKWRHEDIKRRASHAEHKVDLRRAADFLGLFLVSHQRQWIIEDHESSLGIAAGVLLGATSFGIMAATLAPTGFGAVLAALGVGVGVMATPVGWIIAALMLGGGSGFLAKSLAKRLRGQFFPILSAWGRMVEHALKSDQPGTLAALYECRKIISENSAQKKEEPGERENEWDRLEATILLAEGFLASHGHAHPSASAEKLFVEALKIHPGCRWAALFLGDRKKSPGIFRKAARLAEKDDDLLWAQVLRMRADLCEEQDSDQLRENLDDRFTLKPGRLVGEGAFKKVYEATDREKGKQVALAVLHDTREKTAFNREIKALSHLRDRYLGKTSTEMHEALIPHIIAAGTHEIKGERKLAYVTHLMQTTTLRISLAEHKRGFEVRDALAVGMDIAQSLALMHKARVVHGDLKLSNLLKTHDEPPRSRLCDFGGSVILEEEEDTTYLPEGTKGYLAPEVKEEGFGGTPSDIYSLGVVLHEVLTGQRPPDNISSLDLATSRAPEVLRNDLADILRRCLDSAPERRPNAWDVHEELRKLDRRLGASEPKTTRLSRIEREAREEVEGILGTLKASPHRAFRNNLDDTVYQYHMALEKKKPESIRNAAKAYLDLLKEALNKHLLQTWVIDNAMIGKWIKEIETEYTYELRAGGRFKGPLSAMKRFLKQSQQDEISLGVLSCWIEGKPDGVTAIRELRNHVDKWGPIPPMIEDLKDLGQLRNKIEHRFSPQDSTERLKLFAREPFKTGERPDMEVMHLERVKEKVLDLIHWLYSR